MKKVQKKENPGKYQGVKRDRKNIHFENSYLSAFAKFVRVEQQTGNTT